MKISSSRRGFSLIELLVVVAIISVLTVVATVTIQSVKEKSLNNKVLDDLVAVANALEQYKRDHFNNFPVPDPGSNQNINCYYADATYVHDCSAAAFRQGFIDNALLSKRYLAEVPTDPRTGSRYVYGVSNDGQYFQVAGLVQRDDSSFEARTVDNLAKGFELPSLVRAYDGPNFVMNKGTNLPYNPNAKTLTATLDNVNGTVEFKTLSTGFAAATNGMTLRTGDTIKTTDGSADVYFSDGSVSHLDANTELDLFSLEVAQNDSEGILTKIWLKIKNGTIWNKVVRLAQGSEFNVETTGAVAGSRGTEFSVKADGTVDVKSGDVWKIADVHLGSITAAQITAAPNLPLAPVYNHPTDNQVPLTNNLRPHLLRINLTEGVVIADINRLSTPPRTVDADTLIAQSVTMTPPAKPGDEPTYTYDAIPNASWNLSSLLDATGKIYKVPVAPLMGKTVVFQFAKGYKLSAPSWPPVQISSTIALTEAELYPNSPATESNQPAVPGVNAVLESISVVGPSSVISNNTAYTYGATGNYNDGSVAPLTTCTWSLVEGAGSSGTFSGNTFTPSSGFEGIVTVKCSVTGGMSGTMPVMVAKPVLTASCGNGVIDPNEICDGAALNNATCATQAGTGYTGTLSCKTDCTGFITAGCSAPAPVLNSLAANTLTTSGGIKYAVLGTPVSITPSITGTPTNFSWSNCTPGSGGATCSYTPDTAGSKTISLTLQPGGDTKSITIFTPAYVSPNYLYSGAAGNNVTWTQANTACASLTEGGANAGTWSLPASATLNITGEKTYWCGGTTSCPNLSNATGIFISDATNKVLSASSGSVVTNAGPNTSLSYRCTIQK